MFLIFSLKLLYYIAFSLRILGDHFESVLQGLQESFLVHSFLLFALYTKLVFMENMSL